MHSNMDLFTWQFSKEVQPELENYMFVVNSKQKKYEQNYASKALQQVFTELTKEHTKHNETMKMNNVDVITLSEYEKDKNYILTDVSLETSLANLTCCVDSQEKVLNSDFLDFITYIQETLEIENVLLSNEDMYKLATKYDELKLGYLCTSLEQSLTDQGLLNMNQSLCAYTGPNNDNVARHFCKTVLLKKFISTDPTPLLTSILKTFSESYSDLARCDLLIPLLMRESAKWHQAGINVLSELETQYLLKDFLFSCSKLEVWHLSTIYGMLTPTTDESAKRRLINLIEASAVTFCNEKQFMRLFTSLVQKLGKGFEDQKEVLYNIVQTNKTILRTVAHKILNEWVANGIGQ